MSDFLIRLGQNKAASSLVRALGMPLPKDLKRPEGPWQPQFLADKDVFLCTESGSSLHRELVDCLAGTGATTWTQGIDGGPHTQTLDKNALRDDLRPHALIFDASGLERATDLHLMYEFFHLHLRGLANHGRALVVLRPPEDTTDPIQRAARRAVEGFVRSMGRELGRKGATAQTIHVAEGAEDRVGPVLRFLLSKGSAYVSGQTLNVSATVPATDAPTTQPLAGKVALVTGSARGIGEATARVLAREGATVVVMDRPAELEAAQAVATEIGGSALGCDITDPKAAEMIKEHVTRAHGGLDIVVHNAGVTRDKTLANMDTERWNMVLEINLRALIAVNEALLDTLRDGGRIVCLSSIGGIAGNVGQTNYAASKAGVIGYIQGLAPQLQERGITVNAVAPGFIETQMTAQIPLATREVARRLCNLSQGGQPQDIAEAIAFLASPGATGMNGEVLRVCGGNFVGA